MDRRHFLLSSVACAVARPLAATAQVSPRTYRLGILTPGACPTISMPNTARDVTAILGERGYVEGRNLAVEQRCAEGKLDRLPGLAESLPRLPVDVIFALSPVAVQAAKRATGTIPIVMLLAYSDPVELGFVTSLARPGGNITGVVLAAEPAMAGKRLELLKEAVPRAARIAVLTTQEAGSRTQVQWAQKAASSLSVKLIPVELMSEDYEGAFARMMAQRAEALLVVTSVLLANGRERIIDLAAKHRLPTIHDWSEDAEGGGLLTYGGSRRGTARRLATYIEQIFKGTQPAELPVERATSFELVINLKTAKALGLTISPSLLRRADQVIE